MVFFLKVKVFNPVYESIPGTLTVSGILAEVATMSASVHGSSSKIGRAHV